MSEYNKHINGRINYTPQGEGTLTLSGNLKNFKISATSRLKSSTLIECSGGVTIGRFCHFGKGLTIFSTNHNYKSEDMIPYDPTIIKRPVSIEDFVWIGANVTIAPGATIRKGSIVSTGSVIFGEIPECSIVRGNPASVIGYRDKISFKTLEESMKYY